MEIRKSNQCVRICKVVLMVTAIITTICVVYSSFFWPNERETTGGKNQPTGFEQRNSSDGHRAGKEKSEEKISMFIYTGRGEPCKNNVVVIDVAGVRRYPDEFGFTPIPVELKGTMVRIHNHQTKQVVKEVWINPDENNQVIVLLDE